MEDPKVTEAGFVFLANGKVSEKASYVKTARGGVEVEVEGRKGEASHTSSRQQRVCQITHFVYDLVAMPSRLT